MRMEKAKALREELDGVRTRSRRLLAKGNRLVERGVQLKAAAERVMLGNEINKEDEARRLLVERKKVKDTLDLTTARAEVLAELASKLETAIIVLENATDEESVDAAKALAADTLPAAKRASLQEFKTAPVSSRPASMGEDDVSQDSIAERFGRDSLEREFAALEITQLERMLRLTPDDPPISSEDAVVKEDDDDVVVSNTEPAWWQAPSQPKDADGATMTPRERSWRWIGPGYHPKECRGTTSWRSGNHARCMVRTPSAAAIGSSGVRKTRRFEPGWEPP